MSSRDGNGNGDAPSRQDVFWVLVTSSAQALADNVAQHGWTGANVAEASSLASAIIDVCGTGGLAIKTWERWTNPQHVAVPWAVTPYRR